MWWAEGVRFGCTACGRCCVRHVPTATAPLAESEIVGMASALGMPAHTFRAKFTEPAPTVGGASSAGGSGARLRTDEKTGRCLLLEGTGKRCSVYEVRPAACRTYPFWPGNLGQRGVALRRHQQPFPSVGVASC
mmetsp:Transcript_83803/g.233745  ORF Transcript_83803/g.233745 Transcript_83803/m.233745 type:complete len:134 (-) Transcript_83803:1355-1756(-)